MSIIKDTVFSNCKIVPNKAQIHSVQNISTMILYLHLLKVNQIYNSFNLRNVNIFLVNCLILENQ